MNPGGYHFANQLPGTNATHRGTGFFYVYSPVIESTYGLVNWTTFEVPLGPDFVRAWDGKLVSMPLKY